jgi:hypothetical protein
LPRFHAAVYGHPEGELELPARARMLHHLLDGHARTGTDARLSNAIKPYASA